MSKIPTTLAVRRPPIGHRVRTLGHRVLPALAAVATACAHGNHPAALDLASFPPASDSGREQTADQQVWQVLNRLAFGPRPGDVARVRQMGIDQWIAWQLTPEAIPDTAPDRVLAAFTAYERNPAELARDYPRPERIFAERRKRGDTSRVLSPPDSAVYKEERQRVNRIGAELVAAKLARAELTDRQLLDVMTDFWENHFNVDIRKGAPERYFLPDYDRTVIRAHALGRFRDLLGAVAHSPAMLYYLDNWESVADSSRPTLGPAGGARRYRSLAAATAGMRPAAPRPRRGLNENYGRELLELHTLGVDGGYTQEDVINVARAFTGWSIARRQNAPDGEEPATFVFRPGAHDAGPKVVLGHALPAGRGIEDGEDVLDLLADHPATARFIALKLAQRFVSDTPPPSLVARAADTFMRTGGDIRQVLWTIATLREFFASAAYRAKVKSPFEVVVSALRAVNAAPDTTPRTAQIVARLGEPLFQHQAPNGYPETGESWMNTGAILNRINFGLAVAANRIPGAALERWPPEATLTTAPRAVQVDSVVAVLLGGNVSPEMRAVLLSGTHPMLAAAGSRASAGTEQMADSTGSPELALRSGGPQGLAQVVGLALGAPEFQRR